MQGLNSSVITAHVVLNVQGPLGNRDGEQDNETCSTRRLSTSGRTWTAKMRFRNFLARFIIKQSQLYPRGKL